MTGDRTSGAAENIVALDDQHVRAYVPLSGAGRHPGPFADTDLVYGAAVDTDRCPGSETLR